MSTTFTWPRSYKRTAKSSSTSKRQKGTAKVACVWLVGVVLVLGALSAVSDWMVARSLAEKAPGTAEIARMNLREKLDQTGKPMWFSILVPLIRAAILVFER